MNIKKTVTMNNIDFTFPLNIKEKKKQIKTLNRPKKVYACVCKYVCKQYLLLLCSFYEHPLKQQQQQQQLQEIKHPFCIFSSSLFCFPSHLKQVLQSEP